MNLINFLVTNQQGISLSIISILNNFMSLTFCMLFFWLFNEVCVGKKDEQEANAMRRQNV